MIRISKTFWRISRKGIEDEINSPKIAKDFGPSSRRVKGRILIVFVLLRNAEEGPKDKQDWGIYFVLGLQALELFFPMALEEWGPVLDIEFVRQETKKFKLSEPGLALDMPILFTFAEKRLLLWVVEFQEDKTKFSIYKLLAYTAKKMESHPRATVIPMVLFTDRKKWRKDVMRQLDSQFKDRVFLHFEYMFVKLFDFNARDYYGVQNPLVKILLPKMNYEPEERLEVIMQAYTGLFELASRGLFEKYMHFIDVYSEIKEEEREEIYNNVIEKKETVMLAQYILDKGKKEGEKNGIIINARESLIDVLEIRFGNVQKTIIEKIANIDEPALLKELLRKAAQTKSMSEFEVSC